jgi:tetratricopeptide (TPR) repeat protein
MTKPNFWIDLNKRFSPDFAQQVYRRLLLVVPLTELWEKLPTLWQKTIADPSAEQLEYWRPGKLVALAFNQQYPLFGGDVVGWVKQLAGALSEQQSIQANLLAAISSEPQHQAEFVPLLPVLSEALHPTAKNSALGWLFGYAFLPQPYTSSPLFGEFTRNNPAELARILIANEPRTAWQTCLAQLPITYQADDLPQVAFGFAQLGEAQFAQQTLATRTSAPQPASPGGFFSAFRQLQHQVQAYLGDKLTNPSLSPNNPHLSNLSDCIQQFQAHLHTESLHLAWRNSEAEIVLALLDEPSALRSAERRACYHTWALAKQGDWDGAFRMGAQAQPQLPEEALILAQAFWLMGKPNPHRASLRQAAEDLSESADLLALAELSCLQGNLALAERLCARLVHRHATDAKMLAQVANLYRQQNSFQHANSLFLQASQLSPTDREIQLQYAEFLANLPTGQAEARTLLAKLTTLPSNNMAESLRLAQGFLQIGEPALAEQLLAAWNGQKDGLSAEQQAQVALQLGHAAQAQGQTGEALKHFQRSGHLLPQQNACWLAIVELYLAQNDVPSAITNLKVGMKAFEAGHRVEQVPLLLAYAKLMENSGELAEARTCYEKAYLLAPSDTRSLLPLASLDVLQGKPDLALQNLTHALEIAPSNPLLWQSLGKIHDNLGQAEQALFAYQEALTYTPSHAVAAQQKLVVQAGKAALSAERYDLAGQYLSQAVQTNRTDASLFADLGTAYQQLTKYPFAKDAFQEALRLQPNKLEYQKSLGICLYYNNQPQPAIAALADQAEYDLEDLELHSVLARAYAQCKLWHEAEKSFEVACRIAPHDYVLWQERLYTARQSRNPQAIIDTLLSLVHIFPEDVSYRIDLAKNYAAIGKLYLARNTLEEARAIDPNHLGVLLTLAQLLESSGNSHEALEVLKIASQKNPQNGKVLLELASLQHKEGEKMLAVETYKQALVAVQKQEAKRSKTGGLILSNSDNAELRPAILRRLAECLSELGQSDRAIQLWQKALEETPEDSQLMEQLGQAFLQKNQAQSALDLLLRATTLAPNNVSAFLNASKAARFLGRQAQSLDLLRTAARIEPTNPELLLALGRAFLNSEQPKQALDLLTRAQNFSPQEDAIRAWYARALAANGKLAEALQEIENLPVNDPQTSLPIAQVYLLSGNPNKAQMVLVSAGEQSSLVDLPEQTEQLLQIVEFENLLNDAKQHPTTTDLQSLARRVRKVLHNWVSRLQGSADVTALHARMLLQYGNLSKALPNLQAACENSDNPYLSAVLANALLRERDPENARKFANLAVESLPTDLFCLLTLARCAGVQKDWRSASQYLQRALQRGHVPPAVYFLIGESFAHEKEWEKAIAAFEKAVQILPQQTFWQLALGNAWVAYQQNEKALPILQKAAQLAQEFHLDVSTQAMCAASLALAYQKDGDSAQALKQYEQAIQLNPDHMEWRLLAGELALQAGHTEQAIGQMKVVARQMPQDVRPLVVMAKAYLQLGDTRQATEIAVEAVRRLPRYAEGLLVLGECLHVEQQFERALEIYRQAAIYLPHDNRAWLAQAKIHQQLGDAKLALFCLDKALYITPNSANLYSVQGELFASEERWEASLQAFYKARDLEPVVSRHHKKLADVCRLRGHLDQAVVHLGHALELEATPEGKAGLFGELGKLFNERRQYQRAAKAYQSAAKISQAQPAEYWYMAGVALRDEQDYSGAKAMLNEAQKADPSLEKVRKELVTVEAMALYSGE